MPTYSKETVLYDTDSISNDINKASQKATNYITEINNDGINIHEATDYTTYIKIKSGLIEMVRSGVSMLKMWIDTTTKMRLGDPSGKHVAIDSSSGVAIMDGDDEVAGFGSTMHIGKVGYDSPYFSIDGNGYVRVNGAYIDLTPEGVSNPLYYARIAPHYVKVINKTASTSTHAISLYASSSSTRIGLWDEENGCWVLYSNYQDNPDGTYQRVTIPAHVFLANGTEMWDNASGNMHILTPTNSSNQQAEFSFEPDGKIYRRTSTDSGNSWTSWSSIAG